jgi:hypothetical protein
LIFLAVAGVSVTFCSRSFHPIRCDFVAAFSVRTALTSTTIWLNYIASFDSVALCLSRTVPDTFRELAEKDL